MCGTALLGHGREHFAVKKFVKYSRESEERIAIEVSIHRQLLDVRNVVPLLAATATGHISYLVFPFYKRGSVGVICYGGVRGMVILV
ncbi:hypothetical protein ANCCAN_24576, partial [Ancylostoma caninum]